MSVYHGRVKINYHARLIKLLAKLNVRSAFVVKSFVTARDFATKKYLDSVV